MKPDEQDDLLNELLAGEEISELRRQSLAHTLGAVRRQKRRRAIRSGVLVILPALVALAILRWPEKTTPPPAENHAKTEVAAARPPAPTVTSITDEELFALFPDRPMALIGPPGHQQLVFLGKAEQNGGSL